MEHILDEVGARALLDDLTERRQRFSGTDADFASTVLLEDTHVSIPKLRFILPILEENDMYCEMFYALETIIRIRDLRKNVRNDQATLQSINDLKRMLKIHDRFSDWSLEGVKSPFNATKQTRFLAIHTGLADMKSRMKLFEESEIHFQQCFSSIDGLEYSHDSVIGVYSHFAAYCKKQSWYSTATKILKECLHHCQDQDFKNHLRQIIGDLYLCQREFKNADVCLQNLDRKVKNHRGLQDYCIVLAKKRKFKAVKRLFHISNT